LYSECWVRGDVGGGVVTVIADVAMDDDARTPSYIGLLGGVVNADEDIIPDVEIVDDGGKPRFNDENISFMSASGTAAIDVYEDDDAVIEDDD